MHELANPTQTQRSSAITRLIGETPLLCLDRVHPPGNLYVKAEWRNPGGSAKDRPAWNIVRHALESGALGPQRTLLDSTSGNTGVAYAMLGAALGFEVLLCVPKNISQERLRILHAYGAELVCTDPARGSDGAIEEARRRYAADVERYFYADQYNNELNWRAHYETTGPEIFRQTGGKVRHLVCSIGTSGTFMGAGRYLKERVPQIKVIEVQPDAPFHGLEGMKHMDSAIRPGFYDPHFADRKMTTHTEAAYLEVRRLAEMEGLLVGISSGAVLFAALEVARAHPQEVVVTVFPDEGLKYLSERFWDAP